jgi:hypothetical protein
MLSYDRPAIGDKGVFFSPRNMVRHILHNATLYLRSVNEPDDGVAALTIPIC